MEDQFRNDIVEDLVDNSTQNNQYPAIASQHPLDEDQLDDDCKRMCILMLFFDLKMKWRAENSQFKISWASSTIHDFLVMEESISVWEGEVQPN